MKQGLFVFFLNHHHCKWQFERFYASVVPGEAFSSVHRDRSDVSAQTVAFSAHCESTSASVHQRTAWVGGLCHSAAEPQTPFLAPSQPPPPLFYPLSSPLLASPANTIATNGDTSVCVSTSDCLRVFLKRTVMTQYSAGQWHRYPKWQSERRTNTCRWDPRCFFVWLICKPASVCVSAPVGRTTGAHLLLVANFH